MPFVLNYLAAKTLICSSESLLVSPLSGVGCDYYLALSALAVEANYMALFAFYWDSQNIADIPDGFLSHRWSDSGCFLFYRSG